VPNETYIPVDILKPFVTALVISEEENGHTYTVLPGTGPVIGFQYKGNLHYLKDGAETPLALSGITGMHNKYRIFKHDGAIGSVLVYFKPGGAAPFFRQPIHEIFSESLSLDNFMLRSELLVFEERLLESKSNIARIHLVEQFLISKMNSTEKDELIVSALAIIHNYRGDIRIKELAEKLHSSQSPLEKRFRRIVGLSPKKYTSIIRFKHAIKSYAPQKSLTELGYEVGFYDQAHFIREFRNFTGQTPNSFFPGS
jgi:AraC-like DNA-binding protein